MNISRVLLLCLLLVSCHRKSDNLKGFNTLSHAIWVDSLCNEYHFKDSIFVKRGLYIKASVFGATGKLKINNGVEMQFDMENGETASYFLENKLANDTLIFKPLNKYETPLVLFKIGGIARTGLKLEALTLKITNPYKSSADISALTITDDRKIEYISAENNYELQKATFSDAAFYQLEQYLEILKFDTYASQYEFPGFDGANYELHLKTNQYSKTIKSTQRPTKGLLNLMTLIDFLLYSEQNAATMSDRK